MAAVSGLAISSPSPSPGSLRLPHPLARLTASPSPLTLALRASLPPRLFFHRVATLAPPPSLERERDFLRATQ